jgi:gas vesicle protein
MNTFQFDDVQSSSSSFLAGMMWGIAIGAVAAVFLTPRRGSELRGQVADSMNRASRSAKNTYSRASETVNDIAGRAADLAGRAADLAENLTDRAAVLTRKLNQTMTSRTSAPLS